MKKSLALTLLTSVLIPAALFAATEIGVAGSIGLDSVEGSAQDVNLTDLRLKVSNNLSESLRLDAVVNINNSTTVREAYITSTEPFQELGLDFSIKGLSVQAGEKLISFGANNGTYVENIRGVNTPQSTQTLLGSDGLVGRGLGVLYSTDILGFELNSEVSILTGLNGDAMPAMDAPVYGSSQYSMSARVSSTFNDLNVAASVLNSDDTSLYGVDGSYSIDVLGGKIELEAELISATYTRTKELTRTAFNAYAGFDWGNDWTTGVRLDSLSSVDAADISGSADLDAYSEIALIARRELSDSSALNIQYGVKSGSVYGAVITDNDSYLKASLVFNI
jgi:hypothetical protein